MPSVNERLLERQIAHQVGLNRFAGGLARDIISLIDETTADLKRRLRTRLEVIDRLGRDPGPATTERIRRLIEDLRKLRRPAYKLATRTATDQLQEYAATEVSFQANLIRVTSPVALGIDRVTLERLSAIVTSDPFTAGNGAAPLRDWFSDLAESELKTIERRIRSGLVRGAGVDEIVLDVVGRRGAASVLATQRRQVETVVRSAVLHVGNSSREALYAANDDLISALEWIATLDIRVCPLCAARDGFIYDPTTKEALNGGPPWEAGPGRLHPNCRCGPSAVLKSLEELGIKGGKDIERFRESMDGRVPAKLSAMQWIERAAKDPDLFNRAKVVLGQRRAELLRSGKLGVEQLIDFRSGELWTLAQLRYRLPGILG